MKYGDAFAGGQIASEFGSLGLVHRSMFPWKCLYGNRPIFRSFPPRVMRVLLRYSDFVFLFSLFWRWIEKRSGHLGCMACWCSSRYTSSSSMCASYILHTPSIVVLCEAGGWINNWRMRLMMERLLFECDCHIVHLQGKGGQVDRNCCIFPFLAAHSKK